ncbi:MAG: hypothetical protein AAF251_17065 [Pseudomonadota bacterium]
MTLVAALALAQGATPPAPAQPSERPQQDAAVPEPDEGTIVIDILAKPEPSPGEKLAYEACEAEQDAARLRGEIIVCRQLEDGAEVSGFNKETWERDYARRTQGTKTPDVEGAGGSILYRAEGSVFLVTTGRITVGEAAEGPLIIDVEALPEAPPGSDADRIARGLPPSEEN